MSLTNTEKMIMEAMQSFLDQKAKLGLDVHSDVEESSHHSQWRWESIQEAFKLKIADSPFYDSISSAFKQCHDYKYVDHPTFTLALEQELKSRGIPAHEIKKAVTAVEKLVTELKENTPSERDAGWNPNMAEIVELTTKADDRTPKPSKPFTGGGPIPESKEHEEHYILLENFSYIRKAKTDWQSKQKQLLELAQLARRKGMYTLYESIEEYVSEKNKINVDNMLK